MKYIGQSTWVEAVALCELEDSKLPLPQTSQENTDLYNYLNSIDLVSGWLDGTDETEEGIWLDSAGNDITFFNWRAEQPDNYNGNEHFLMYRSGWGGTWNDHTGTHTDAVVCQKPAEIFGKSYRLVRNIYLECSKLKQF